MARPILARNLALKDRHKSERCFILGTGPSIKLLDLSVLGNEVSISLNSFFLHENWPIIQPKYHVMSGLALHPHIGADVGADWIRSLEQVRPPATMLLNYCDRNFINTRGLLRGHEVFYFEYRQDWSDLQSVGIDATAYLYPSGNVAVMAIQQALYMGFCEIVLLGLDHDWFIAAALKRQTHFYTVSESIIEKGAGERSSDWYVTFTHMAKVWRQYKLLDQYARKNGVRIVNATPGGILDVFERVSFADLLTK